MSAVAPGSDYDSAVDFSGLNGFAGPQVHLDTLTFNDIDNNGVWWIVVKDQGWFGAPANTSTFTQKINRHGTLRTPGFHTSRAIEFEISVSAPDIPTMRLAQHQVQGILTDPYKLYTLQVNEETGPLYTLVSKAGPIVLEPTSPTSFRATIALIAPDPFKYNPIPRTDFSLAPIAGGGLIMTGGITFTNGAAFNTPAGGGPGVAVLFNYGQFVARPVITLVGPLNNPYIVSNNSGKVIKFNANLATADTLVIDMSQIGTNPPIVLLNNANRRYLCSPAQFNGFEVPPMDANGIPGQLTVVLKDDVQAGGSIASSISDAFM